MAEPKSKPEWYALLGNDSKAALAALHKLDGQIEIGMTKEQVLAIFPPDVLVRTKSPVPEYTFGFTLRKNLHQKILVPHAYGVTAYSITFGKNQKVVNHLIILGGDI